MVRHWGRSLLYLDSTHGSGWVEQNVFFFFNPYLQKLQSDFKNVNFEWCGITRAQNQSVGPKTRDRVMRTLWPKYWIFFENFNFWPNSFFKMNFWIVDLKGAFNTHIFCSFHFSVWDILSELWYISWKIPLYVTNYSYHDISKTSHWIAIKFSIQVQHHASYKFYYQQIDVVVFTQWATIAQ